MKAHALALWIVLLSVPVVAGTQEHGTKNIVFIMDGSNSMWSQIEGQAKIEIAQQVLSRRIENLPVDVNAGLIVYGHRRANDCNDIETLVDTQPLDKAELTTRIRGITPTGKTPIAASIEQAVEAMQDRRPPATIILMTDGKETCNQDPCGHVRRLRQQSEFELHVIGFDIASQEDAHQLRCLAEAGAGDYFTAATAEGLDDAFEGATSETGAATGTHKVQQNTQIVLDVSAAMTRPFEGTTRFAAARNALETVLQLQVADRDNLAYRWFGGPCGRAAENTQRVFDFGQNNAASILQSMRKHPKGGDTTLVDAVSEAAADFQPAERFEDVRRRVIIITGGIDPCYRPAEVASLVRQRLQNRQIQPHFRFIGIDMPPDQQRQLNRIADATSGEVTFVDTPAALEEVLKQVLEVEPAHEDIEAIVGNLNELIGLIASAIGRIEAKDYPAAEEQIEQLAEIAQRAALPFRDLGRRKSNADFQRLFDAARQLRSIQLEMVETAEALLVEHRRGDRDAYNDAARTYNDLTVRYVSSVENAQQIQQRLQE